MTAVRMPHLAMFDVSGSLHPMSEKVQGMANSVYNEFEGIIGKYGSETVKGLMPVVVHILESLDHNLKEKQQFEVDFELSKVELEHLKKQFEREKASRRSTDSKFLETEDLLEEAKKQLNQLKSSSELTTKRLEIKIKNLQDHVGRLEEKDNHTKEEYARLHHKYSDLLKNHTDYVHKSFKQHQLDLHEPKKNRQDFAGSLSSTPVRNSFMNHNLKIGNHKNGNASISLNSLPDIQDSTFDQHTLSSDNFYSLHHELLEDDLSPSDLPKSPSTPRNTALNYQNILNDNHLNNEFLNNKTDKNIINHLEKQLCKENHNHNTTSKLSDPVTDNFDNQCNKIENQDNDIKHTPTNIHETTKHSSPHHNQPSNSIKDRFGGVTKSQFVLRAEDLPLINPDSNVTADSESITNASTSDNHEASISSHSQDDLSTDNNKNNNVDILFGECMLASNSGILDREKYLKSMGHLLAIEEDSGTLDVGERNGMLEYGVPSEGGDVRKNVSLYEELSVLNEDNDIISVGAEVDKLIQENNELMETKNALNVLKDDLISEVEELSGEVELLREEMAGLLLERSEQDVRVRELEEDIKLIQGRLDEKERSDKDSFSRIELVRVLMERNQYKEKLMELQEAVRWAETMRAQKAHPEMNSPTAKRRNNSSGVWGMFNSFLGLDKPDN